MKIALAQLNYHIGNFVSNTNKIIQSIEQARKQGADIVVFAELAISGYPPRDFLEFDDFIEECRLAIGKVAKACVGIAAVVGGPIKNQSGIGKSLYNAAWFLSDGEIKKVIAKTLLPTYDVFDEYRYFEPNSVFEIIVYKGYKLAVTICEDLWNINDDNPMYQVNPMDELMKLEPDFILNIAASPFHYDQSKIRQKVLIQNAKTYKIPLFYVNHVGAQTELLFDGGSLAINSQGAIVEELAYFEEEFRIVDLNAIEEQPEAELNTSSRISLIYDALVMGVRNYFHKLGFEKAILGLSGGIDSAVTLVIAAEALGAKNVHSLLLPSQYSSDHSIKDAEDLANNLGSTFDTIPIKGLFEKFDESLAPYFKDLPFNIAEENIQARTRGLLLMAFSNKFGHILLNTSNKSEAAVGYGTLYGDMNGGLSVLGDVYKIDVFSLARYINRDTEIIPWNTINKPPSAELRPDQKDSDSLPDYEELDAILYQYIEKRKGPKEIIAMGFKEDMVLRVLKMVNTTEHKRYQTPPILRISSKAFGMGRRMPIVAKYLS